jgi:Spy/CpxP family protein refolding chaperone
MTKIRSTILALALVAAAGSVAQAQNAPTDRARVERAQRSDSAKKQMRGARQMRGKRPQGVNVALRGIQLTDAQRTQVTAIQKKYQDQFKAMRDSAKPAPNVARDAKQDRDTAAARAAFSRMQALRARMEQLQAQQRSEIRAVLTAEQQKTFDQNVTEMQARGERRGRRGGRAGK